MLSLLIIVMGLQRCATQSGQPWIDYAPCISCSVSTLSGSGAPGFTDGAGTSSRFQYPMGLALHPLTNALYVADAFNGAIRIVSAEGTTSSIPGLFEAATNMTLTTPTALAFASDGALYIADAGRCLVARVSAAGAFGIFVGGGGPPTHAECGTYSTGTIGTSARFDKPYGLAHYNGFLYVSDVGINRLIIRIDIATRRTETFHVTVNPSMSGYPKNFYMFTSLAADSVGNIFSVSLGIMSRITEMPTQLAVDGNDILLADGSQNTSAWVWSYGMYSATAPVDGYMDSGGSFDDNRFGSGRWSGLGSLAFDASGIGYAMDQYSVRALRPVTYPGGGAYKRFTVLSLVGGGINKKAIGNANGIGTNALFRPMTSFPNTSDYDIFFGGQNHGGLGIVADPVTACILFVSDTGNHVVKKVTCIVVSCTPTPSAISSRSMATTATLTASLRPTSSLSPTALKSESTRSSSTYSATTRPTVSGWTKSESSSSFPSRSPRSSLTLSSSSRSSATRTVSATLSSVPKVSLSARSTISKRDPSGMSTTSISSTASVSAESFYATLSSSSSPSYSVIPSVTNTGSQSNAATRTRSATGCSSASVSVCRSGSASPVRSPIDDGSRMSSFSTRPSTNYCEECVVCPMLTCSPVMTAMPCIESSQTNSPLQMRSLEDAVDVSTFFSSTAPSSTSISVSPVGSASAVIAIMSASAASAVSSFSLSFAPSTATLSSSSANADGERLSTSASSTTSRAFLASLKNCTSADHADTPAGLAAPSTCDGNCTSATIARTAALSGLGGFTLALGLGAVVNAVLSRKKRGYTNSSFTSDLPLSPHSSSSSSAAKENWQSIRNPMLPSDFSSPKAEALSAPSNATPGGGADFRSIRLAYAVMASERRRTTSPLASCDS